MIKRTLAGFLPIMLCGEAFPGRGGAYHSFYVKNKAALMGLIDLVLIFGMLVIRCDTSNNPAKSSNAKLKYLSIKENDTELIPAFDASLSVYATTALNDTKTVKVSAETVSDKAHITYLPEIVDGSISLNPGANTVIITVTAEDGTTQEYTINITVADTIPISGSVTVNTNSGYTQEKIHVNVYRDEAGQNADLLGCAEVDLNTHQWSISIPVYSMVYFKITVIDSTGYQFGKMAGSVEIPEIGKDGIALNIGGFALPELTSFNFDITKNEGLPPNLFTGTTYDAEEAQYTFSTQKWIENIGALKATFEAAGTVTVDGIVQESGVTANDFRREVIYAVTAEDNTRRDYTIVFESPQADDFPVININTDDRAIDSTETWLENASFSLYDEGGVVTGTTDIKGRGHSTWSWFSKKPYSIKLSKKAELFNMLSHKRWNLLANASDVTLLRNQTGFKLVYIFDNMAWTPHSQQVHLYINNEYVGVYQLTEAIKIDENRVNISEIKKKTPDGGYILSIDNKKTEAFNFTTTKGLVFNCEDPDEDLDSIINGDTISLFEKIKTDVQHLEDVLYSDYFTDENNGYRKYIDVASFVDWYLASEIADYHENRWSFNGASIYMYYDSGKYFAGPLWDFDFSFEALLPSSGFLINTEGWIKRLFEDPYFILQVKNRWNEKKTDIDTVLPYIDAQASGLEKAQSFNFIRWNTDPWDNTILVTSEYRQQKIEDLKTWLAGRINWLDSALNAL
ncbi:MAG: CotH kinase family protein [Treponema sp.]|nr:CotH kinase family protein [Treponema sp.]